VSAQANNNANENDSCYDSGTGEGDWLRCTVLLLHRHKKELNWIA